MSEVNEETRWILNFILSDLAYKDKFKLLEKAKHWTDNFEKRNIDSSFAGVRALATFNQCHNLDTFLKYSSCTKAGRLANGFQSDMGTIVHAVAGGVGSNGAALCGSKPGRRSVGWVDSDRHVNCEKCNDRIHQLQALKTA